MHVIAGADDESPSFQAVIDELRGRGVDLEVVPARDWPSVAVHVAESVASGEADMGVLMCWTGTGTSIMANKVPGVRAALCWEPWIAEGARRWNDANVLVMSSRRTSPETALEVVDAWLAVDGPDSDEVENIERVAEYEKRGGRTSHPVRS